jgi:hypothetical protein
MLVRGLKIALWCVVFAALMVLNYYTTCNWAV